MNAHNKSKSEDFEQVRIGERFHQINKDNEYTPEEIERMKKINNCVEKGSLIVGAGIAVGCAVSAITINPLAVMIGLTCGTALAAGNCLLEFNQSVPNVRLTPCSDQLVDPDLLRPSFPEDMPGSINCEE